jgi:hypothetical protein
VATEIGWPGNYRGGRAPAAADVQPSPQQRLPSPSRLRRFPVLSGSVTTDRPIPDGSPLATYRDWQRALSAAFLAPQLKPAPFLYFLDDDEAARRWPQLENPAEVLARSVAGRVDWGRRSGAFSTLAWEAASWALGSREDPPPTLPLLAVTVMAASQMHRDDAGNENAFFVRLAQRLQPAWSGPRMQDLRQQLSQSYGPVAEMWQQLHQWVGGRRADVGVSTIIGHPRLTRIGYALSQALVNRADRLKLTAFYAACGNRELPPPSVLLRQLQMWATRPHGLSATLVRSLDDSDLGPMVAEQVHRLAVSWDGVVLTGRGLLRVDLRIVLDVDPVDPGARWVIPVVEGLDNAALHMSDGTDVTLVRQDGRALYLVDGLERLPGVAAGLASGLSGVGKQCEVVAPTGEIILFRENEAAAGWLSVRCLHPFEEHLLAVRPHVHQAVKTALEAADPGAHLIPQGGAGAFLPGWYVYEHVQFSREDAFEQAATSLPAELAMALRPDRGPRPKLADGLPLSRRLGTGLYLSGGEPDLVLPTGSFSRERVEASLDGVPQKPPFKATGFPISLRLLGPFSDGPHEVAADGETLTFHTYLTGSAPAPRAALKWAADSGYVTPTPGLPGPMDVCGARVPGTVADPLLLRRDLPAWVLDSRGVAVRVQQPDPASWLAEWALPPPCYFEFIPDPASVWLVTTPRAGTPVAKLLRWHPPSGALADRDQASAELWRELQHARTAEPGCWKLYLDAQLRATR